jgi:hypothetical protein
MKGVNIMKSLKKLSLIIPVLILINFGYCGDSKNPLINTIEKKSSIYETWKFDIYTSVRDQSEQKIWSHAKSKARDFVDLFFHLRGQKEIFTTKLESYLLPGRNCWDEYFFSMACEIDEKIKMMIIDVFKEAGLIHEQKGHFNNFLDYYNHLEKRNPGLNNIVNEIYRKLERMNQNSVPESQIHAIWERYSSQKPETIISLTAFAAIGTIATGVIIFGPASLWTTIPATSAGFAVVLSSVLATVEKKEIFYEALLATIYEEEQKFNINLKNIIFGQVNRTLNILKKSEIKIMADGISINFKKGV